MLIFARAPEPHAAKTRLIPALGAQGAASLQAAMTELAVSCAARSGVGDLQLWCTPSYEHASFARLAQSNQIALRSQCGATLGERLRYAHDVALGSYEAVLIMGTDCPALTPDLLQQAVSDLAELNAVIVPAEDGGYVLLGLSRRCPEVFDKIDWGTERVLQQTLSQLQNAECFYRVYPTLWDVDRPQDVERLRRSMPGLVPDS